MRRLAVPALLIAVLGCTSRYQVRGNEQIYSDPIPLRDFVGTDRDEKSRQITMEHQSVERFDTFTTGIIEISDDGTINPRQYDDVMEMVHEETAQGGLLVVFVHGWHHGARTCDRDLCCYRGVLDQLSQARRARQAWALSAEADPAKRAAAAERYANEKVVGVFIGWRGESIGVSRLNVFTLFSRKRVAQRIGRTAGREILQRLDDHWRDVDNLTMVTVGHSLGGAFVYEAVKGKLTGDVADIELPQMKRRPSYRIVRAHGDRAPASRDQKAERADLGDLVVLVNPAIEAIEYEPFDRDLRDDQAPSSEAERLHRRLPYDKNVPYEEGQMPVLMVIASEADSAVGKFFPIGRTLQAFFTLHWNRLRPIALKGMGRYEPLETHRLEYHGNALLQTANPNETGSPDCGCPMSYEGMTSVADVSGRRFTLQRTGEKQEFGDGFEFRLTDGRRARGWDPASPYFSVLTDVNVISAHSDIFNSRFVGFLSSFLNAYDERVSLYGAKEKVEEPGGAPAAPKE